LGGGSRDFGYDLWLLSENRDERERRSSAQRRSDLGNGPGGGKPGQRIRDEGKLR